ncbi:MAG: transposase, partial [Bacteroidales bacterium]|nr:transposase [Bacteroidales bacterium]
VEFEVVLRSDNHSNEFRPAHKRWVVERSFSWLENFRRLTTDYEFLAESSVAIVQLAFIRIMLNKII